MKYTKYFGIITKEQGRLNLPTSQFQRMMNIVHIEGVVAGLAKAKETYKDTNQYYKYDMVILKEKDVLANLTGNLAPDLLLREMMGSSD
ncbi:hypothetical protein [Lutibacter sp.]|uniref:hypothetical protein n=1 Tax=Lutibacter sp. TaxID=1925666 RepID=UPI00356B4C03